MGHESRSGITRWSCCPGLDRRNRDGVYVGAYMVVEGRSEYDEEGRADVRRQLPTSEDVSPIPPAFSKIPPTKAAPDFQNCGHIFILEIIATISTNHDHPNEEPCRPAASFVGMILATS